MKTVSWALITVGGVLGLLLLMLVLSLRENKAYKQGWYDGLEHQRKLDKEIFDKVIKGR